jgi:hypothetical protein
MVDTTKAFEVDGGIIISGSGGIFSDDTEPDYDAPNASIHLSPNGPKFRINGQWTGSASPRVLENVTFDIPENELVFDSACSQLVMRQGTKLYKWCVCAESDESGSSFVFSDISNSILYITLFVGKG